MKKIILSTLMVLATTGCFAKLPNMKEHGGLKIVTKGDEILYSHDYDSGIPLYRTGTFKLAYLENYDPLTKCTYTTYGLFAQDKNEPFCLIEDAEGNFFKSQDYLVVEKEDHTFYYFHFNESNKDYRFVIFNYPKTNENIGYFQTFQ